MMGARRTLLGVTMLAATLAGCGGGAPTPAVTVTVSPAHSAAYVHTTALMGVLWSADPSLAEQVCPALLTAGPGAVAEIIIDDAPADLTAGEPMDLEAVIAFMTERCG